jgi:hypothetical protein
MFFLFTPADKRKKLSLSFRLPAFVFFILPGLLYISSRSFSMLSNEDKAQIRELQQDLKDGLLSEIDFTSMRQIIVEQAKLRFVVEQTAKRQKIEPDPPSEEPRNPECTEKSLPSSPAFSSSNPFFIARPQQAHAGDNVVPLSSSTLNSSSSSSSQQERKKPVSSFRLNTVMPVKGNQELQKDKSGYAAFHNQAQVNAFRFNSSATKGTRSKMVDTLWSIFKTADELATKFQMRGGPGLSFERFLSIESSSLSAHTANSLVECGRYMSQLESILVDLNKKISDVTHRHAVLSPPSEPSNYAKFDLVGPAGATFETEPELFSIANLSLKGHGKAFDSFTRGVFSASLDKLVAHRENVRNLLSRFASACRRIRTTLQGEENPTLSTSVYSVAAFMTVEEVMVRFKYL